jgi:microcystin-dependent protein
MNRLWIIVLLCTVLQVTAFAVPEYINYQARIFDATGAPMQGTYAISFAIFDASREGNMVWGPFSCDGLVGEGHADAVVVWDGWFNVILGPRDAGGRSILPTFGTQDGKPRFIEIQVQGKTISPRQQFLTAPYAMEGYYATQATYAVHGVPPGCVLAFVGAVAPEGWLLCDGSPIPEGQRYDALRAVVGPNTPDLRGRTILMADPLGTVLQYSSRVLGATSGEEAHVLTYNEMPSHRHSFTVNREGCPDGGYDRNCGYYYWTNLWPDDSTRYTTYEGSNWAHNNMPPYIALNWIIKY